MNARLVEVLEYADRARAELSSAIAGIDGATAVARPAEGAWSVRDVVEHLHLVEKSSLRAMFRALRNAKSQGEASETDNSSLLPLIEDVERRIYSGRRIAPDFTTPTTDATLTELLEQLRLSREGLHNWAKEADGTALNDITFPHPALGQLSLYGWVVMLGAHERRHSEQIRGIVASLGS